ncbi:MAG: methyltransferase domain-containing protein [Ignavibacteria bacterium]|nr:methyltransferase domain-containing protein [Ignavibacteria bacterium]
MSGTNGDGTAALQVEEVVRERYSKGAQVREAALCCPVEYDPEFLKRLPEEILERDYGCGDPSQFVREGDVVLDLGSGGGKICYIAAQITGPEGKVIGIDMNDEMLALARKYREELSARFGTPVDFRKGKIQDLALDLDLVAEYLSKNPIDSLDDLARLEEFSEALKRTNPMVPDQSVDLIVSNCVLNLVREADRKQMFSELFRVLKRGGRVAVSDIVSDEEVPSHLKNDPKLWSGCVSGAFTEEGFLRAFEEAGFYGMEIVKRDERPWQVVEGVEFRSMTILAFKGKEGRCLERNQAVIYNGPWKTVTDDDGHTLYRGSRMAVCGKTFRIYTDAGGPYGGEVTPVEPYDAVSPEDAKEFNCRVNAIRDPRETKGIDYDRTQKPDPDLCGPEGCC